MSDYSFTDEEKANIKLLIKYIKEQEQLNDNKIIINDVEAELEELRSMRGFRHSANKLLD